ncbi:MAG: ATP-binding protein [Candidatus Saccharimonas sp.]
MEGSTTEYDAHGGALTSVPLFLAAAHELKSPLALIRQLALELEAGECNPKEAETIARQITLTAEKALRVTTGLTKTARLEDGLFTLEPLNPVSLCEDVVEELAPLYRAKGREIHVAKRSRPLLGLANKDLLRRVLLSFGDNALHYSEGEAPVIVTAAMRGQGSRIRLGVRDYGPAMPTHAWDKLASSLGERPQPLHDRPESSGLGIYVARQFAEAMSAEVGATRHRDGATFYIDISTSTQLRLL